MIEDKRILLNGTAVKSLKQPILDGDKIDLGEAAAKTTHLAEGLSLVYQDADILIIDKPAGLLTSTHDEEPRPTVIQILNDYVQDQNQKASVQIIHRLDRDASGLLVFARNNTAFTHLKQQFADHSCEREYTTVVHGVFRKPTGRLEHMLYEDERGLVHVAKTHVRSKQAILDYETLKATVRLTLLKCKLHTGRKHQIRVQLKSIGHPVCGDILYGTPAAKSNTEPPHRLALHATHLAFIHPKSHKKVSFNSPTPSSFLKLMPI
jgi:RluA family pseudouridine synthase